MTQVVAALHTAPATSPPTLGPLLPLPPCPHLVHVGQDAVVDGQQPHLDGRQPQREGARVVLHQDAKEALQAAKYGPGGGGVRGRMGGGATRVDRLQASPPAIMSSPPATMASHAWPLHSRSSAATSVARSAANPLDSAQHSQQLSSAFPHLMVAYPGVAAGVLLPTLSPVDHDGPLLGAAGINVVHVKALWQVEVQLDGGALPLAPNGVLDLDVNLGAVEGAATLWAPHTRNYTHQ